MWSKGMRALYSAWDVDRLAAAMETGEELSLTRSMGGCTVTVATLRASRAWEVPMLARVRIERGAVTSLQTFPSLEEAMRSL